MTRRNHIIVRALSRSRTVGWATCGNLKVPCALGRSGRVARKREGDGGTPSGRFRLLQVRYRADQVRRPRCGIGIGRIRHDDGWCDATSDRNYNRSVKWPYPASCEEMWRADGLYDLVIVIDYNIRPRRRGAGSAIFMHVARPGWRPTEGCVALERRHLERLMPLIGPQTRLIIA